MVAVSKTTNGASKYVKMKVLPDVRGVTIGKFAKKKIAEFSRVETDNYRPLRKPLAEKSFHSYETFAPDKNMLKWLHTIISNAKALRALIMAWNASISSFISMNFATVSTGAHNMKTCSSVWL